VPLLLISAVLTAAAAASCMTLAARQRNPDKPNEARPAHPFLLAAAIAGAALVQASHAAFYGFGTLHWQASGFPGPAMGGLWALGVLSEVAVFSMLGYRMTGAASAAGLLVLAAAAAVLRWTAMSRDPGLAVLLGLQLTQGMTFAVTHLGSIFLLARLAPEGMQARAQTWLAGGWAGVMALLTTLSGRLYGSWGEEIYLVMALVASAGSLLLGSVALALRRAAGGGPSGPALPEHGPPTMG